MEERCGDIIGLTKVPVKWVPCMMLLERWYQVVYVTSITPKYVCVCTHVWACAVSALLHYILFTKSDLSHSITFQVVIKSDRREGDDVSSVFSLRKGVSYHVHLDFMKV